MDFTGPVIKKRDAKAQGLKKYFTGKPCKNGHLSERLVSDGHCIECKSENTRKRRESGYFRQYQANRYANDPEYRAKLKEWGAAYYQRTKDDPEKISRRRAYYEKVKGSDAYKQSARARTVKWQRSEKGAEWREKYANSDAGRAAQRRGQQRYKERKEAEVGMPLATYKLAKNPQMRLRTRLNTRISHALKVEGIRKKSTTAEMLGCSIAEFKKHISENWDEDMNWENYGQGGWHVDHLRPCISFDLSDEAQQKVCFNWRNLFPMWGEDNIEKSDRYDPDDEGDWSDLMRSLGFEGDLFLVYGTDE